MKKVRTNLCPTMHYRKVISVQSLRAKLFLPDLTPFYCYLWNHANQVVYKNMTETGDQLRERIQNAFNIISNTVGIFETVRRMEICILARRNCGRCINNIFLMDQFLLRRMNLPMEAGM